MELPLIPMRISSADMRLACPMAKAIGQRFTRLRIHVGLRMSSKSA